MGVSANMRKLFIDSSQTNEFQKILGGKTREILEAQNGTIDSCIWALIEKGAKQTEIGLVLHQVPQIGDTPTSFAVLIYRNEYICYEFLACYNKDRYQITVVENKPLIKKMFRGAKKPMVH
jgi:hypothetical protein